MQIEPQADAFAKRYGRGEAQVVWTTLVADLATPVSACLKIAGARPMSFLLESVEGGAVRGRYSVIGLAGRQVLHLPHHVVTEIAEHAGRHRRQIVGQIDPAFRDQHPQGFEWRFWTETE